MKKKINKGRVLVFLASFFVVGLMNMSVTFAQEEQSSYVGKTHQSGSEERITFKDRLYFGGYLGLQFGTVTLVNVSPVVSCAVSERFGVGIGLSYQFYQDNRYVNTYQTHMFGGRAFARYYVFRDLFAQAEYEGLNFDAPVSTIETERMTIHSYFIGAGYRQWLGQKAFMSVVILWNLNENIYYPYSNPVIRIGAGFGF